MTVLLEPLAPGIDDATVKPWAETAVTLPTTPKPWPPPVGMPVGMSLGMPLGMSVGIPLGRPPPGPPAPAKPPVQDEPDAVVTDTEEAVTAVVLVDVPEVEGRTTTQEPTFTALREACT
ncbi:hypothetical protein GCM10028772_16830 [Nocardioides ultimimeridianus]